MQPILLFNFLPNNKILDWSKWKAPANDIINFAKMMIILDRGEIIVEKKKKMLITSISSFFTMFSKSYFLSVVKSGLYGKWLNAFNNFFSYMARVTNFFNIQ